MAKVSFEGIGEMVATFLAEEGLTGGPVKMTGDGKVGPCGDGEAFCGVALEVNDGLALVQLRGFVKATCGDAVAVGYTKLSANAGGGVKTNASGTAYLVVEAGSAEKQATILL